jgi:hypothetical protein
MKFPYAPLLVLCLFALPAAAQSPQPSPPPEFPSVRVGILSYLQYDAELENRNGLNSFDLTRMYLNINGALSKNIRFRFTPDIRRVTDGSLAGSLTLRVKYGFLQFDNVGHARSWLRLGLHQTPWLDFEEGVNRYRVQGTMFSEREGLIPGSADFGAGYFTPIFHDFGDIQFGIYNGEGFTQPEVNKYKSLQGRITVRPLPKEATARGLRLSAFYNAGWYAADRPRRLGIVMASFEHPKLVATLQHVMATERPTELPTNNIDRSGDSGFLEVRQGLQGWAAFARIESFDPDDDLPDNSHRRAIAGVAYWFRLSGARLGLVLNDEDVRYDAGALHARENRLLAQAHVEF